jgi:phosphonatase-like hydrolase
VSTISLVVCDITGTLVDDGGAVVAAYGAALEGQSIPFTAADVQAARGGNKPAMLAAIAARAFGEGPRAAEAGQRAFAQFQARLVAEYAEGPLALFPGVEQALEELCRSGIKLATNTGFPQDLAAIVLQRLAPLKRLFAAHVAGDEVPAGRPAPYMIQLAMQRTGIEDVSRLVVVGDTPLDLSAGINAGAAGVVGVLTGSHGVETLGRVRHTHLLPSIASLPALIREEFSW